MSHEPPRSLPASIEGCFRSVFRAGEVSPSAEDLLPAKAARLREQFLAALVPYSGPQPDGSGQYLGGDYLLGPHSALPTWFNTALFGIPLQAADGPYPEIVRIWGAVDWPSLLTDHPDFLVLADGDQAHLTTGPHWVRVQSAYTAVCAAGHIPVLDVAVSVSRDARIMVCPLGLIVPHITNEALIATVSGILIGDDAPAHPPATVECDDLRAHTGHVEWSW